MRSSDPRPPHLLTGWDIGGAHVKACRLEAGRVVDVLQCACPLWQGLDRLDAVLDEVHTRWPDAAAAAHAVTMTGEMVDLFTHRADGVARIAQRLAERLGGPLRLYAGPRRWVEAGQAAQAWPLIASANWRATAQHAAGELARQASTAGPHALLVDIGSTTTDLIALAHGRPCSTGLSDRDRLASGELVYHGVVRTPLCALAPRITLQGRTLNVMHEFFATTADVYRLTGELDPAHDLHAAADGGAKTVEATQARLARMVGCDRRDASAAEWLDFAHAWRRAQLDELAGQAARVITARGGPADAGLRVVAAGCGAFLVPELMAGVAAHLGRDAAALCPVLDYGRDILGLAAPGQAELATRARVCAPSVAVAVLALHDAVFEAAATKPRPELVGGPA